MLAYAVRRIAYTIPSLAGILLLCFALARLSGDPTDLFLPPDAPQEARDAFRAANGLDLPVLEQLAGFAARVMQGDFGQSLRFGEPAARLVAERVPATLELALATMAIALCIGLPAGMVAAYARNSPADLFIRCLTALGQAVPTFYWGVLSIIVFSLWLRWLPTGGRDGPLNLILPAATLALTQLALVTRVARSCMLDVMRLDFVRTARAKGLGELAVVAKHAARNACLPVITVVALQFGLLIGGVVVTETTFSWPGVGRLAIQAIYARDYPIVQAVVFFFAVVFVLVNLLADLACAVADPRVRLR